MKDDRTPDPTTEPRPLGDRETDLMQALWALSQAATVAEVHRHLANNGSELAYTTVQTMLNRLEAKGQVSRERDGRAHRYAAAVPQSAVAGGAIGRVVERFFGGSSEALASHLIGNLHSDELERVRELLERNADPGDDDERGRDEH